VKEVIAEGRSHRRIESPYDERKPHERRRRQNRRHGCEHERGPRQHVAISRTNGQDTHNNAAER
jgi:hypothetical protein